jgi:hypothetical protein
MADVSSLDIGMLFVVGLVLGICSSTCCTANIGNTEEWLPPLIFTIALRGSVTKASCGESTLRPSIVDASKMPLDRTGRCVSIKLIPYIDQILNRCYVDIVDGGKVKNDGLQYWLAVVNFDS